ncbi:MAG: CRISPR-associated endonuclease Cas2 [Candidatus Parvarchaeota archaeon]|nr:CRISPR-associated endonuclease Cas2 [Candidatus Jingweiarchaeum tengchongense]MCW1300467.1 CRISPR-associated endonuclease Cas2 [Candidatus Jingweiarchaeum tengchongense]MCW1304943.1 CRISPR-associated endonuclease Cas2 [Candidatus Jingweiarchaeum tengchongense]MCW1305497.1 CRISPR-associated endonuclease Cas2 [Candidatus Jingweiarchaeum tengchongense]MCW1310316.1 CRISPR-associated endonuclease Cas2 [Candidatus Jingweiarchaeum tengchongense]
MYVIIVYDISIDRVNNVCKFLRQYLHWIQNSAFEGELTEAELEQIKIGLKEIIKLDEDSILFFILPHKRLMRKEVIGIEKSRISTII